MTRKIVSGRFFILLLAIIFVLFVTQSLHLWVWKQARAGEFEFMTRETFIRLYAGTGDKLEKPSKMEEMAARADLAPEGSIVQVRISDKHLSNWDCYELAGLRSLVFLQCNRCSFPKGGLQPILEKNANLYAVDLRDCMVSDPSDFRWSGEHSNLQLISIVGSNLSSASFTGPHKFRVFVNDDELKTFRVW